MQASRAVFESLGCEVVNDEIDLAEAGEIFMLWRAWRTELRIAPLLKDHKDQLKDTVIWNAEQGLDLTGPQLARAEAKRTEIYHRMRAFMSRYEYFVLPVNQVLPFSVDAEGAGRIHTITLSNITTPAMANGSGFLARPKW